jgi:hypothetical protein
MSNKNDTEKPGIPETQETPELPGAAQRSGFEKKGPPVFCAVEEHAAALGITVPVFAAVRQYKGWASGKKVDKNEFERAVKDFLGSPAGGK